MRIEVNHHCSDFNSYRAARVKSLFNAEKGCDWSKTVDLPIEGKDWKIGLIVGPSGSGKTSIGSRLFGKDSIYDLYSGWDNNKPIVDCIDPDGDFNTVTGMLSAVGLGDVPAWLRPFNVLSNGERSAPVLQGWLVSVRNTRLSMSSPPSLTARLPRLVQRHSQRRGDAAPARSFFCPATMT